MFQNHFSALELLRVWGNMPGFWAPCFYSEKLYKTPLPKFLENAITLFSQCCLRKEGQPKSLKRLILFGLAFLSQFVMANMPVSHENASLEPQRE